MTTQEPLDREISDWFEADAPGHMPDRVLRATFERTRTSRQRRAWRTHPGSTQRVRLAAAFGVVAVLVVAVAAGEVYFGHPSVAGLRPTPTRVAPTSPEPTPTATVAQTRTPPSILAQPYGGRALGWSRDGTRLLIQKDDGNLFVRHADGSEVQLTQQLSAMQVLLGSARPSGASISPDGTRVVFAGVTSTERSCHDGALFGVDADGGPAEVLWKSHLPQNGIVRYPTFSPDGTLIAFVDDYCDSAHTVWVMDARTGQAREIVSDPLGAGHVRGLAWSPVGDRLALLSDVGTYTFAPDGSDLTKGAGARAIYCWPGLQC